MKMIRHLALAPIAAAALLVAAAAQAQTGPNPVNYQAYQDFNSGGIQGTVVARFSGVDNVVPFNQFDTGITWQQLEFWGSVNGTPYGGLIYSGANLLVDPSSTWSIGDTNLGNATGFLLSGLSSAGGAPISITWAAGLLNNFNGFPDSCSAMPAMGCGELSVFDGAGNPVTSALATTYANVGVVPEPSTYLMMGLGLAALGFVARKRKA